MEDIETTCEKCGASFVGPEIPLEIRHLFGGHTHWDRKIAIVDQIKDCYTHLECPDCGHRWERGNNAD